MGNSNGSILVQFRAGRCKVEGTTVTPDTRKGVFRIIQDEQHLKHVQWIDRSNGLIEEDYFTFSDVDLERISQSSGRVFLLRWRDRSNKLFFWMQETNAERDEDHFLLIRQALNGPEVLLLSSTVRLVQKRSGSDNNYFRLDRRRRLAPRILPQQSLLPLQLLRRMRVIVNSRQLHLSSLPSSFSTFWRV